MVSHIKISDRVILKIIELRRRDRIIKKRKFQIPVQFSKWTRGKNLSNREKFRLKFIRIKANKKFTAVA